MRMAARAREATRVKSDWTVERMSIISAEVPVR